MKYNRFSNIYADMGYELRDKFIAKYNMIPALLSELDMDKFNACMQEFIQENANHPSIIRSCMIFPELKDIPHPDQIPERWGLSARGREMMKDAYIEKMEMQTFELSSKITELENRIAELTRKNIMPDNVEKAADQAVEPENGSDDLIAEDIYQKLFGARAFKYRYALLEGEDILWIRQHVAMSDLNQTIFEACCDSTSLKEVSEKTGISLSRVKHGSAAIIETIKCALTEINPELGGEECL